MVESYISENDVKLFIERYNTTVSLGKKHGVAFTALGNAYQNSFDVIMSVYAERLDKSSKRLNRLTVFLIALTFVLAIVEIFNIVIIFR
ncbi:hypothetical protein ACFLVC_04395 [Chloroflexota bacterium]